MLFGDGGNDRLLGKRGDDFIDGGNKDDVANGAGGTDHCIAETQKKCESGPTAHGLDWQFGIAGQALEVTVGDSVTWTWTDGLPHTIWGSGVETAPHTHTEEFDSIGVFPYMCTIHPSMTGAITVVAP